MPRRDRERHGESKGYAVSKEYVAWQAMIARCEYPANVSYPNYGAKGIRVCPEWRTSFSAFLRDMGRKPSTRHSLDRIDNGRGYEPGNCRWATRTEQNRNRRSIIWVDFNGRRVCLAEASKMAGLSYKTVKARVTAYGWTTERALSEPIRRPQ